MKRLTLTVFLAVLGITTLAGAQNLVLMAAGSSASNLSSFATPPYDNFAAISRIASEPDISSLRLAAPVALPRMAPELALKTYERRAQLQAAELVSYSATTLIHAELPESSQHGDYELLRRYSAPRTLEFKAVHFDGDGFVKSNIITRLLQSEVEHLQKDDGSLTALNEANYKFAFKGTTWVDGRLVHVYQIKPRQKRAGLIRGHVCLDAYTGSLARVVGAPVKSPSFFLKKIDFVQEYADVNGFTFPVHTHSEAQARIVGRAVVDIIQRNYQPVANTMQTAQQVPAL